MYFLTFIFLLLYKVIQQNIECKIIWKNPILNLKKRRKKSSNAQMCCSNLPKHSAAGTRKSRTMALHTDVMYSQATEEISMAPVI